MVVYRIALKRYIKDLTGSGARIYGGRWNHKGVGVIYTSESIALATLEYLVNASMPLIPDDLVLAKLDIPDNILPEIISVKKLPKDWRNHPAPLVLAELGTKWIIDCKALLLRVPSAVIDSEYNILINPGHPDMKHISIKYERFKLDNRFIEKMSKR
jgi:RES domain-containing protein